MAEADLIDQFVASFAKLDEMWGFRETDPIAWSLRVGDLDEYGGTKWLPARVATDPAMLTPLYQKMPARFPPLYEQLVLSYRWATVDLGSFRLLANPPDKDLTGLLAQITADRGLQESLIPAGYIQFGKGPDMDYDPVCFDIKSRTKGKDYRIVKIDHEEILCNYRVKVVTELAPTFEQLVLQTIERANTTES
jgi:hypothetical protein